MLGIELVNPPQHPVDGRSPLCHKVFAAIYQKLELARPSVVRYHRQIALAQEATRDRPCVDQIGLAAGAR